jgi:hypothetical protein
MQIDNESCSEGAPPGMKNESPGFSEEVNMHYRSIGIYDYNYQF